MSFDRDTRLILSIRDGDTYDFEPIRGLYVFFPITHVHESQLDKHINQAYLSLLIIKHT